MAAAAAYGPALGERVEVECEHRRVVCHRKLGTRCARFTACGELVSRYSKRLVVPRIRAGEGATLQTRQETQRGEQRVTSAIQCAR